MCCLLSQALRCSLQTPLMSIRPRQEIARVLDQAAGCNVELIMKDISTVRKDPSRLDRWSQIAMEEAERRTP